jgi:hypothetical protein
MIVMVPIHNTTINELLKHISKTSMEKIYHRMTAEDEEYPGAFVEVYMPRVVINSDFVLNKALEKVRNHILLNQMLCYSILYLSSNYQNTENLQSCDNMKNIFQHLLYLQNVFYA